MIPDKTPSTYTNKALDLFYSRECDRDKQKMNGRKVEPRVLLTIVGKGENRHLEAREDTVLERIRIFFSRKNYKLEKIQTFLKSSTHDAKKIIDAKISNRKLHPQKNIIQRIFEKILKQNHKQPHVETSAATEKPKQQDVDTQASTAKVDDVANLIKMLTTVSISSHEELHPYKAQLAELEKQHPSGSEEINIAKRIISDIELSLQDAKVIAPPQEANFGIVNPELNACFLNATLQGLGKSPLFLQLLEDRRNELKTTLTEVFERTNLAQEIDDFADDVYAHSQIDLDQAGDYVQGNSLDDEGKLFVQLALVSKLHDMYKEMQANTIDLETIQTLRSLIIASGFREYDTDLYSQEDAGMLCMQLLDAIGMPQFTYQMNIAYPASFPIPALDRQGDMANIYAIQLSNAKSGTAIQDLVRDTIVEEEVDKTAIKKAKQILTREQEKHIDALPDTSTISTLQSIAFPKGKEPKVLPIWLKRYTATGEKITTEITPSYSLDFPVAGKNDQMVRYRLVAVAVHEGPTLKRGHFYTYAPQVDDKGKTRWVCYNDSIVTATPNQTAYDEVAKKGYIYYYEYVGNVKIGTPPLADLAKA